MHKVATTSGPVVGSMFCAAYRACCVSCVQSESLVGVRTPLKAHSPPAKLDLLVPMTHGGFLQALALVIVTDVPRGSVKHVRFSEEAAIQDLRERAEKILAIWESEELAEEAVRLGRMVSSNAPLY